MVIFFSLDCKSVIGIGLLFLLRRRWKTGRRESKWL